MRTSSRPLALLLFDEVELLDIAAVLGVLSMAGRKWNFRPFKVSTVASRPGHVQSPAQVRIEAAYGLSDCPPPEIVVVPGGYGARVALRDPLVVEWLSRTAAAAAHVVGVGNGVLLLAKAGALPGLDVSIPHEAAELLAELSPGARADLSSSWRESGNVLSAATATGATYAALELVSKVLGKKQADGVAAALGIRPEHAATQVRILTPE